MVFFKTEIVYCGGSLWWTS